MVVTGNPWLLAALTCAWTSGVAFWLLYTYTLMALLLICLSMVALSAGEGSVPSLIALRKPGGVSRSRPRAGASIEKIDSEAPTGVPAKLLLIWLIVSKYCLRLVLITVSCCRVKNAASAGSIFS